MVPLILTTASLDHFRLCHLLMVSSSSESQKLVVSSSLLIMVLELSYPARWRSNRLWPFMRGPDRWQENFPSSFKSTLTKMINALYFLTYFCQPLYIIEVFGRHNLFFIIRTVSCFFPHRVAPCPLCAEVSPSWRKRQIRSPSAHPGSPHCPSHWDCCRKTRIQKNFFFFLLLKVPTDYIATGRLLSKILQQAFALTVQPCFFLFISKLQILPSWEKSVS